MTEDFNTEAFRYLLDELDAEGRAVFEARLAHDPMAWPALKACADSVARFAGEIAPAEALPPVAQRAVLAAVLATMVEKPRARLWSMPWRRLAWPLAASLLLGLNLLQFFRFVSTDTPRTKKTETGATAVRPVGVVRSAQEETSKQKEVTSVSQAGGQGASPADQRVAEELHRLEKLRSEYANLERARDALSAEYDSIIRQLAQRALMDKGVGRLTAMELVDAASYARGERKGLVDIARGILTEPGIVAVTPVTPPAVPPTEKTPEANPIPTPPAPTVGVTGVVPTAPNQNQPPAATQPETTPQTATETNAQPYAWSVYDEVAGRGYLNLYNLPTTTADQSLQLWVKVENSTTYQSVGTVPLQFYGGSGSLYYTLPEATPLPVEILVTQEPRNAVPAQPTGPTVLRGP
jgi:hypothetical protein